MKALFFYAIICCLPLCLQGQPAGADSLRPTASDTASGWSFYAGSDYYILPADQDILMLVTYADRGLLHLEARYNYEDPHTGSVFAGLNLSFGKKLRLSLTPMAGAVFGRTNGIATGLETDLSYKIFYFNSQSEYVFDFSGQENNFAYTYLQLGAGLLKHFTLGMAAQRTRVFQNDRDLQRGLFAGYHWKIFDLTFTYFNPFADSYFFIASLSASF